VSKFELGRTPGFAIVTRQQKLFHLLSDRTVDLRTSQELNRYIHDRGTRRGFETYQMLVFL
jgi:hypothetical protein